MSIKKMGPCMDWCTGNCHAYCQPAAGQGRSKRHRQSHTGSNMLAEERAYLIAGKLARYFESNVHTGIAAEAVDDEVTCGEWSIVTPQEGEPSAEELAERFNSILAL